MTQYNGGQYRRTRENYPIMDAIAVAVAVDNAQGFVKAGGGSAASTAEQTVYDNRTVALHTLRNMSGRGSNNASDFPIVLPTDADREQAQEIFDHFAEIIVMAKLSDTLTTRTRDGRKNDFNVTLSEMFTTKVSDISKELAMVVSLPNSRRVSDRRAIMSAFYDANRANGYVSKLKARVKLTGRVMDVKFVPHRGRYGRKNEQIHFATVMTTDNKIVSFMMNNRLSRLANKIVDTDITFVGSVKEQGINVHTQCQYTLLNSIRIDQPDN
jgi:hypothetical protein